MKYRYTVEYHSAIKKNKIMPFATTRMDPETVKLRAVSQTEEDKYHGCGREKPATNKLVYKISIETVTVVKNTLIFVCFLYLLFCYQEGNGSGRDKLGDCG